MKKSKCKLKMKNSFCKDCIYDYAKCNKNPLDCQDGREAELYFKLYDEINAWERSRK